MECYNFSGMNLAGYVFTGAKLDNANFSNTNLEGAKFKDAEIENAKRQISVRVSKTPSKIFFFIIFSPKILLWENANYFSLAKRSLISSSL